jgi:hypothetical protein
MTPEPNQQTVQATPGPWVAVEIGQGGPHDNPMPIFEIRSADGRAVVAEFVDAKNAALLSAAPDLRHALKLCALICAGEATNKNALVDALEAARAALAKAGAV